MDGVGINSGNRKAIGVEICYSMDNGYAGAKSKRYIDAENNTIEYVAYILLERGWDVSRVKQHWNYSGKDCPHKIRAHKDWNNFVNKIAKKLQELKNANSKPKAKAKAPSKLVVKKTSKPVKKKKAVSKVKPILTGKIHVVKSGDTLWGLSNTYKVSVEDIKKWNKLKSDRIFEDMKLFVSEPVKKTVIAKKKAPVKANKVIANVNKQIIIKYPNARTKQEMLDRVKWYEGQYVDFDKMYQYQCILK